MGRGAASSGALPIARAHQRASLYVDPELPGLRFTGSAAVLVVLPHPVRAGDFIALSPDPATDASYGASYYPVHACAIEVALAGPLRISCGCRQREVCLFAAADSLLAADAPAAAVLVTELQALFAGFRTVTDRGVRLTLDGDDRLCSIAARSWTTSDGREGNLHIGVRLSDGVSRNAELRGDGLCCTCHEACALGSAMSEWPADVASDLFGWATDGTRNTVIPAAMAPLVGQSRGSALLRNTPALIRMHLDPGGGVSTGFGFSADRITYVADGIVFAEGDLIQGVTCGVCHSKHCVHHEL